MVLEGRLHTEEPVLAPGSDLRPTVGEDQQPVSDRRRATSRTPTRPWYRLDACMLGASGTSTASVFNGTELDPEQHHRPSRPAPASGHPARRPHPASGGHGRPPWTTAPPLPMRGTPSTPCSSSPTTPPAVPCRPTSNFRTMWWFVPTTGCSRRRRRDGVSPVPFPMRSATGPVVRDVRQLCRDLRAATLLR